MKKLTSRIWQNIRDSVSVENTKTGIETGKAVLETAKILKEQKGALEASYDILKPVLQNSSSLLDIFCSPLAQVIGSALPFVPVAVGLLNFARSITKHEPDLEECIILISQAAYIESFQEQISLPVNQAILSYLDTNINIKVIQQKLNKLGDIELDAQATRKAIVRFPESELAQAYNQVLFVRLQQAGISEQEAEVFTQQVLLNTENHFVTALLQMGDSVKQLVDLYRNGSIETLQKTDSIDEYLQKEIAKKATENVFDEDFNLKDIYVPLNAKNVDANGNVEEKSEEFGLEIWAKNLLLSKDPTKHNQVLFIQGGPGRGKSVFCRMFADWVREYLHPYLTPILIRLRDIDNFQLSLEVTLNDRIKYDFAVNDKWLLDSHHKFLFILDGFDELRIERSNNESIARFIRQVGTFQQDYAQRGHRVIITGRQMALYGIDRLPPNLERVELADMNTNLQIQWFFKWYQLFPSDKTLDFQQFLQDNNRCPSQLQELAKEPLLLYMLAAMNRDGQLDICQIEQSKNETQAKITVYEQALEWVLEKQRYDKRHGNLTEELTQLDPDALKRLLAEAAIAVVQSAGEYASIRTVKSRLQQDDAAKKILEKAEAKLGKENALKNTLAAFYIKSNDSGGVEFFHKSFREFLCAERIKQSIEEWIEPGRKGKSFYIEEKQLHEQIYDLLGYGGLTSEIVEYLFGLLDKSTEFKQIELFDRLNDFYQRWCDGEFIDSKKENLPLNIARRFHNNGIEIGVRAVDIYTGLNVMILLLELHRKFHVTILPVEKNITHKLEKYPIDTCSIKTLKSHIKSSITFYPSGKPQKNGYLPQLLLIISYSSCTGVSTFSSVIGTYLSGAYLSGAYLSGADLSGADLSGADLSAYLGGANLAGANLTGAYLGGANLTGANLSGTNLTGANLTGAYLGSANLTGASLGGANLTGANLGGANLTVANLRDAKINEKTRLDEKWVLVWKILNQGIQDLNLNNVDISGANLTGANLTGANLTGANLTGANLTGANLTGADLTGADLSDANLTGADLTGADLTGADLTGADLSDAKINEKTRLDEKWVLVWKIINQRIQDLNLNNANLSHANLNGANLSHANLNGANLSHAHLSEADLSEADLSHADLSHAHLSEADLSHADLSHADLSHANLIRANLSHTNLGSASLSGAYLYNAINLTLEQVKVAYAWKGAKYDYNFSQKLDIVN